MTRLFRWYRWINILSLDVAAGAVACAAYFVTLVSLPLKPIGLTVLGLAVWVIYTADHLKDAHRIKETATTERHRFHQQHFTLLSILVGVACLAIVVLAFRMDRAVVLGGIWLSALVVVYLVCNHYLAFIKEVAAGALYCAGVFLPAMIRSGSGWDFLTHPEVSLFVPLVVINLLLFSYFEAAEDIVDNHKSFALHFGKAATILSIKFLLAGTGLLIGFHWSSMPPGSRLLFVAMTSILLSITIFRSYFKHNSRYRYWGDSIFLFPAITLLV